jgi:hypothetical protein
MRRLATAMSALVLVAALAASAGAQDMRFDGRIDGRDNGADGRPGDPSTRPPASKPRPHFRHRFFPCCVAYSPSPPPPLPEPAEPPIVYVVPTPPTLVYVPTPRVEPAPEIQGANGRWERHGNGKEYPYTWVWVPSGGR